MEKKLDVVKEALNKIITDKNVRKTCFEIVEEREVIADTLYYNCNDAAMFSKYASAKFPLITDDQILEIRTVIMNLVQGPKSSIENSPPRIYSMFGKDTYASPKSVGLQLESTPSAFCKFYYELSDIQEDEGFLTFSNSSKHVVNIKSMFIRDCYRSLYTRIINQILPDNEWSDSQKIHLTGTPGIGKTTFIVYMMWMLIQHPLQPAFVYSSPRTDGFFYLCKGKTIEPRTYPPPEENVIRLVDGFEGLGALTITKDPIILLTSLRSSNFNEFKKFEHDKLYMNIWSLEELIKCATKNDINVDHVRNFFGYFGGIPRSVFKILNPTQKLKELEKNVENFDMVKLKDFAGETHESDRFSGMLLHIIADNNFQMVRVVIASPYIAEMMMKKLSMDIYRDLLHELLTRRSHADPSGYLFENFAHKKLVQQETYNVKRIKGSPVITPLTQLHLPKRNIKCFHTIPDQILPNLYYIPNLASFPTLDSFEYPNVFYNITSNREHNITLTEESAQIARIMFTHQETIMFFFFVPSKIYSAPEFKCKVDFSIVKKGQDYEERRIALEKFKNYFSSKVEIYLAECDLEAYLINKDWKQTEELNNPDSSN